MLLSSRQAFRTLYILPSATVLFFFCIYPSCRSQ
jgi:ABC-type sugar transport system permease subunit